MIKRKRKNDTMERSELKRWKMFGKERCGSEYIQRILLNLL